MPRMLWCKKFQRAALLAACSAMACAAPALAHAADSSGAASIEPPVSDEHTQLNHQSYPPDYFTQFAPRNAYEMVLRIPGFAIVDANAHGGGQRGLGEANQNVIVNGARFSSKSDSIQDQLQRIPASDVVRIEILDGTTLDIPGLTGQVANVVYTSSGTSGQFRWRTGFRPHNTEAQLYGGEISVTGSSGEFDYTLSLSNNNDRYGADGPTLITDGAGNVIEEQFSKFSGKSDNPRLSGNFSYDFGGGTVGNLNVSVRRDNRVNVQPETGIAASGLVRERDFREQNKGPQYEIGGDIEFPFGPGRLKLIGLERFERDKYSSELVDAFGDGSPSSGFQFNQTNETGERIGRFEYGWNMWEADWQLSGEAAFNRLDRASNFFELAPNGSFVELPFPGGNGGVTEDRYETILSFSKQLTPKLSMQLSGGGEYSKIEQTGTEANSRTFQRPKGSLSLAWKPQSDFDVSIEFARRVSQLSFGDFLASVSLDNENQAGANNQLVPYQSWDVELEFNKSFGAWGSAKLQLRQAWFEDFIDFFPLVNGGEARGNIGDADRFHVELNTTLKGEPIGFKGAQLEVRAVKRWMHVTDPFTGLERPFSFDQDSVLELRFRHDVPGSDWAWGSNLYTDQNVAYSRRREIGRDHEGPTFINFFVEHKDVFGMTVNATVGNILGARNKFERTVFDGDRPDAGILFDERRNRRIGPIFRFSVSGNF